MGGFASPLCFGFDVGFQDSGFGLLPRIFAWKASHAPEGPRPPCVPVSGFGFWVSGFGCRLSGAFGFGILGFGFRLSGVGVWVSDVGVGVLSAFGFRVLGLGFRLSGVGCRVSGVGFGFRGLGVGCLLALSE